MPAFFEGCQHLLVPRLVGSFGSWCFLHRGHPF
jgi:hypothetical protein